MTVAAESVRRIGRAGGNDGADRLFRFIAWANIFVLVVFLFEIWATQSMGMSTAGAALNGEGGPGAWLMLLLYPAAVIAALVFVIQSPLIGLREDADRITAFNAWLVRAAFFAVLFVGLADAIISFMRVEELLPGVVGDQMASDLSRPQFRGEWVHLPLIALGVLVSFFTRSLGFTWLALLIVAAELLIVISRFVFSYEQAFMGDLVRFWYAALFLFASAYTLLEEGHVRVDVFYAAMPMRTKALVNSVGALVLGIVICWTILVLGMGSGTSIIMAPLLNFEVTQTGFGMYVKYLMAGFLALFAVTMLIQFAAMLLDSVADRRGDPGHREHDEVTVA